MRNFGGGGGGRVRFLLPSVRNASTALALLCVVSSVVWFVLYGSGIVSLYLEPYGVISRGHVWQLITWMFPATDVMGVLFSALIVWQSGGFLESYWGRPRFLRYLFITMFTSGVLTVALIWVLSLLDFSLRGTGLYVGGPVMASILWVAQGLAIWHGETNLFGYPMTGRTFAAIGVLLTALTGVFSGPWILIPEVFGLLMTFAYIRWRWPGAFFERLGSWRLKRQLSRRASQLKVVSGGQRNMPSDSDKYLH